MWTMRVINKEEHTIYIVQSEDIKSLLAQAFAMCNYNKITLRRN